MSKKKMTKRREDAVILQIARGSSARAAAKTVGVAPSTLSNHLQASRRDGTEFAARWAEAEEDAEDILLEDIKQGRHRIRTRYKPVPVSEQFPDGRDVMWIEEIIERHPQDAKWLLATRKPGKYSLKVIESQFAAGDADDEEPDDVHSMDVFFARHRLAPLLELAGYDIDWDKLSDLAQREQERRLGRPLPGRQTHDGESKPKLAEYERGIAQPPEPVPQPIDAPGERKDEEQDNIELIKKLFNDD